MITVPSGAAILGAFEAEAPSLGKGVLYLLDSGLVFESRRGDVLDLGFGDAGEISVVKKDRMVFVPRGQNKRPYEFRVIGAADAVKAISGIRGMPAGAPFDQDAHSESEARWFEANWDHIMTFLKPERAGYLSEFVKNVRIGTPSVDPYLLVVDHENLTYKDFADLKGFLRWRYGDMTEGEAEMAAVVFRDFEEFSVSMLEMDVQMCRPRDYKKKGFTFYQFVSIVAREKCESVRARRQLQSSNQ